MTKFGRTIAPGEGERIAQRGYVAQYQSGAAVIYAALDKDQLEWVGLADRNAGIADDIVLGLAGKVIGHQFKTSTYPTPFEFEALLLGAEGMLQKLVHAWKSLCQSHNDAQVEVRFVTNNIPTTNDHIISKENKGDHSAAFLHEFELHHSRSLSEWRETSWKPFIDRLWAASSLSEAEFEQFLRSTYFLTGSAADFILTHKLLPESIELVQQISMKLPHLVADKRNKDRWSRAELLQELGWPDRFILHRQHQFPIGAYVQRNRNTEQCLLKCIEDLSNGYIALVGSPGAGKSTLLQSALSGGLKLRLVRYLAYMPGEGQGIGRGEAQDFLDDLNAQLRKSGLHGRLVRNRDLQEKQLEFESLLRQAGERYLEQGIRTLIIIDGLDHIPREERPARSLLAELPLPEALPNGVLILLGTQKLELESLKHQVREQASEACRNIHIAPLTLENITKMASELDLDESISRQNIYDICQGHPLVARYLIEALRHADAQRQTELLNGEFSFEGDIERVYKAAWREVANDDSARKVIDFIARAEGAIPPELLAMVTSEEAVEKALRVTGHLLNQTKYGWSIFHNSFRLFVLEQPKLRFGKRDLNYSSAIYCQLAELTRSAESDNPQRWLELRYLARAQQHQDVLRLAQPSRFRHQLADFRPVNEIQADIRLALSSVKSEPDVTSLFRLLLAGDEIGRRSSAIEYASASISDALMALGDIESIYMLAEGESCDQYKIIDTLLEVGDVDNARILFNEIDPFSQDSELSNSVAELESWAQRVFYFRDIEQINSCLDRLKPTDTGFELDLDAITFIRYRIAQSILKASPNCDLMSVADQLQLIGSELACLKIEVGLAMCKRGDIAKAEGFVNDVYACPDFQNVPNNWRRQLAQAALQIGNKTLSAEIFKSLDTPHIALLDTTHGNEQIEHIIRAMIDHSALAAELGLPIAATAESKYPQLRPLQYHANAIGTVLGKVKAGHPVALGTIAQTTEAVLSFLGNKFLAKSGEFDIVYRLNAAESILRRSLIQMASIGSEQEFKEVIDLLDSSFFSREGQSSISGRLEAVKDIFQIDSDSLAACKRLEDVLSLVSGDTPEEYIDLIARISKTFVEIGNVDRARELLRSIHGDTLGYALRAKKDPQYALWGDILECANDQDQEGSEQRVLLMLKQLIGMSQTEGRDAAYRLSHRVLTEAALSAPALGYQAAKALTAEGLLSWSSVINALMIGVVRRNPKLALSCAITWSSLALPFYVEPFYRENHTGEFISHALELAPKEELSTVVEILLDSIEIYSTTEARVRLLQRVIAALSNRELDNERANEALSRWQIETPTPEDRGTPNKSDGISSLILLDEALHHDEVPSYESAQAFERLLDTATLEQATSIFDRWTSIQGSSRARFSLLDRALTEGDRDLARRLMVDSLEQEEYPPSWSHWRGAAKLKYFQARLKLDGPIYDEACQDLLDELTGTTGDVLSTLIYAKEIFPTICAEPDWKAIWDQLAEQLVITRENSLAQINLPIQFPSSDEALIASLFRWALSLSAIELTHVTRDGALRLAKYVQCKTSSQILINTLLDGGVDEQIEALQLLLRNTQASVVDWSDRVPALVNHTDYVVSVFACCLLDRWGQSWVMAKQDLPLSYQLELISKNGGKNSSPLIDSRSKAMLVEDPLGWTAGLDFQVNSLARASNVKELTIRHRCAALIKSWGGLEAFGQVATTCLESALSQVDMRITYARPHIQVALRALRHVAGELRLARSLDLSATSFLLYGFGYQVDIPLIKGPIIRPHFLPRPLISKDAFLRSGQEQWLAEIELDLSELIDGDDLIIAEISKFHAIRIRRKFEVIRTRAPFYSDDSTEACAGYSLPKAYWLGGVWTDEEEPSPTIVRKLEISYVRGFPGEVLVICPYGLQILQWRHDPDNWMNYIDETGECVAKLIWWRDGAPLDVSQDQIWGEGVVLIITSKGRTTLEDIVGPLEIWTHACRVVGGESGEESVKRYKSLLMTNK